MVKIAAATYNRQHGQVDVRRGRNILVRQKTLNLRCEILDFRNNLFREHGPQRQSTTHIGWITYEGICFVVPLLKERDRFAPQSSIYFFRLIHLLHLNTHPEPYVALPARHA